MRRIHWTIFLLSFLVLHSCAGGDNLGEDVPVDLQLTVYELEKFDENLRAEDMGKVGQVTGTVISAKRVASNEKQFGSYFIHIYTEKKPGEEFDPQISCYTWGNPRLRPGEVVRLTGIVGRGAAFGHSLLNCRVERM